MVRSSGWVLPSARFTNEPRSPTAGCGASSSSPSTNDATQPKRPLPSPASISNSTSGGPTRPQPRSAAASRTTCFSSLTSACSACSNRCPSDPDRVKTYRLGAQTSLTPTVLPVSISRIIRFASSTGCSPDRNVVAKKPSTRPPRRRSKSRRMGIGRCFRWSEGRVARILPRTPSPEPRRGPRRDDCYDSFPSGEWRNWQTRRIQVPVSARTWGFNSPLAHHL